MKPIDLKLILEATGGYSDPECGNPVITGISTDTRKITQGCLYIALTGERFDGHDFIADAFRK
ncbi:MAG TPA: Mur ligase domain-containing protein, partial [Clostridia bacterium]|nr:Mur ligase domain-containing protein [Clostridia bacterium]